MCETVALNSTTESKRETLLKLLLLGPETLDRLVQITGWGREATQQTLLILVVDGYVGCRNGQGHRTFYAKQKVKSIEPE